MNFHPFVAASVSILFAIFAEASAPAQNRGSGPPSNASESFSSAHGEMGGMGSVTGTVRTLNGHPIKNASVQIRDMVHGTLPASASTNSSGYFALYNIPPGTYEVSAGSGSNQSAERVQVTSTSAETSVELRLAGQSPENKNSQDSPTVSVSQYSVPAKARSLYNKALLAVDRHKLDEAKTKVDAALAIYPKFAEALALRGMIEEDAGKKEEAIADYQQAIQNDPSYAAPYIALASLLNSSARFKESLPYLTEAERLAPNVWQVYFEIARCSVAMHDFAGGVRNADRATQLQGGPGKESPEVHLIRGYALVGLNEVPRATKEIETFLAKVPPGPGTEKARQVLDQLRASTVTAAK